MTLLYIYEVWGLQYPGKVKYVFLQYIKMKCLADADAAADESDDKNRFRSVHCYKQDVIPPRKLPSLIRKHVHILAVIG